MNRKHVLLVGVVLAGVLLLPSAAAPFSGAGDQVSQDLVLHPHSGPNGAYAVMEDTDQDADAELALRFDRSNPNVTDGVNPDAVTPFDRVFNITYTGEQSAEVWLTSNVAGVSFYRGTDPTNSAEGRTNNVTLGPGQTLEVGVVIDTTGRTVPAGDTFTLNARLAEPTGTETMDDGEDDDESDQTPTPTSTPTTTERAGGSSTGESGGNGGTSTEGGGPQIEAISASVSNEMASPGESVTVDATVENVGSAAGTATVRLFANGDVVGTQEVTVPAGESRSVAFTTSFDTVGEHDLRVEDVPAGTLLVQSQQAATTTPGETTTVAPVTSADLAEEPSPTPSRSGGFPWLVAWLALLVTAATVTGYWTVQYTGDE